MDKMKRFSPSYIAISYEKKVFKQILIGKNLKSVFVFCPIPPTGRVWHKAFV